MANAPQIKKIFQQIQVVRPPKHRLATFGTSRINYQLVTEVPGLADRSRLRTGVVTAEKPNIITPQSLREQFAGFGEEADVYVETLVKHYGKALRGLEYEFRNEVTGSKIELVTPDVLIQRLSSDFDNTSDYNSTIIKGADRMWELSVMKFIVEETLSSFSMNLQELQDRGFFEGDRRIERMRKREVENLFRIAKQDSSAVRMLGAKLKEYGLFEKYQDAFFQLIK